eukprot:GCRY01002654.1.p1 GENE.GCRY01002654.1~~GCRY01002654.1.p1  ORF type:complete len:352 (+),score=35.34 GCRY01002654.1:122-1177(+)
MLRIKVLFFFFFLGSIFQVGFSFVNVNSEGDLLTSRAIIDEVTSTLIQTTELEFPDGSLKSARPSAVGSKLLPAHSCLEVLNHNLHVPSGLYWLVDEDGGAPFQAFCDMETDGGGWTLLMKIGQDGVLARSFSETFYNSTALYGQWIKGVNISVPLHPNLAVKNDVAMESVDWSIFLKKGRDYQLRQVITNTGLSKTLDVAFDLPNFPGFFLQEEAPSPAEGVWPLLNRNVLKDNTDISFMIPTVQDVYFWPPFTPNIAGGPGYTACGAFNFSTYLCGAFVNGIPPTVSIDDRRFGNAGIIMRPASGITGTQETAASWMPMLRVDSDVIYAHLGVIFHSSAGSMVGLYYIR